MDDGLRQSTQGTFGMSHSSRKQRNADRRWNKHQWLSFLKNIWKVCNQGLVAGPLGALMLYLVQVATRPSTAPIETLIRKEAELAKGNFPHSDNDLTEYAALFADDGIVIDHGRGDLWKGHVAIVDRIIPLHFSLLNHIPRTIQINGSDASAETYTTFTQDKPTIAAGAGKENWQFRKIDGKWKITSFDFDLPP